MTPPNRGATRLRTLVIALAFALPALACSGSDHAAIRGPSLMSMARALGSDAVRALIRGYVPGRSGEILLVPKPWNVLGQWNDGFRGSGDPRTTHSSPWGYHQRVPLSLFGPGYVRGGLSPHRPVDVADLAPTLAELLDLGFRAPAGHVLREALAPRADRREPPRLIVVVVWDGGGWNVLQQWPQAWPVQRRLMRAGTTYVNATVGSAPTVTAPIHATIGTGAYPRTHGIVENTGRLPDGSIGNVTFRRGDLRMLRTETLADAWDRSVRGRAWVGMLGYWWWHLTMMGRGASTGDRDVAVLWDPERNAFTTNPSFYELPPYLPDESVLQRRIRDLDAGDGALDGEWMGGKFDTTSYTFTANPAFAAYQGDAALALARHAPIGTDDVTDLLFVELKTADVAGHIWNMLSPEVEAVIEAQDEILEELVAVLDDRVGRRRYVLAMTADHGQSPIPEEFGGLRIDRAGLFDDINERFGDVVEALHPTDLYLYEGVEQRVSVEEIARFIGAYRYGDGLPEGLDEGDVPRDLLDEQVFVAALPGSFLEGLSPAEIDALGRGKYPEGRLREPVRIEL